MGNSSPPYRWSSSDETVATVDGKGLVTAQGKKGRVAITVIDSLGRSAAVAVTVGQLAAAQAADDGCGCGVGGAASSPAAPAGLLLLALGLAVLRRR